MKVVRNSAALMLKSEDFYAIGHERDIEKSLKLL